MRTFKIEHTSWWLSIIIIFSATLMFTIFYSAFQALALLAHDVRIVLYVPVCLLLGCGITAVYALVIRYFEQEWTSSLCLNRLPRELAKGIAIGIIFFLLVTGIMAAGGWYRIGTVDLGYTLLKDIAFYFLIACGEEVLFRGVIFRLTAKRWNTAWALAVSALLFGFTHIMNEGATVWSSIAIALEAGVMLGMAYRVSGTLWLPIGIHWAWNVMEGPVLGFAVSGNEENSMIKPIIEGPEMITGGSFGAEASVIAIIIGLAVTWIFWLKSRKDILHAEEAVEQ